MVFLHDHDHVLDRVDASIRAGQGTIFKAVQARKKTPLAEGLLAWRCDLGAPA
jgi:hypothetical protein